MMRTGGEFLPSDSLKDENDRHLIASVLALLDFEIRPLKHVVLLGPDA